MKLKEAQNLIKKVGIDGFLFSSQANVFYLSGFRSTHAYIILTPSSKVLLTDGRYYEKARAQLKDWEVVLIKGRALRTIKNYIREMGIKEVGFESDRVSYDFRRKLKSRYIKWVPFSNFLQDIRAVKTRLEIDIMREGVKKSDSIFRSLLEFIRPGLREIDVRAYIVEKIFEAGSTGESFPAIIASGEGSAIPHWETSTRPIKEGPLLIDMGLMWNGYCTDFTRTLYIGTPDRDFEKIYTTVRDAHLFALERVREGNKLGDVDRAAREHIKSKRLGKYFNHSTGHGIGVEIHEFPRVYYKGEDSKVEIREGMVFTVEPGIYIPGKFGVRLENIVVVRNGVGEPLSDVGIEMIKL